MEPLHERKKKPAGVQRVFHKLTSISLWQNNVISCEKNPLSRDFTLFNLFYLAITTNIPSFATDNYLSLSYTICQILIIYYHFLKVLRLIILTTSPGVWPMISARGVSRRTSRATSWRNSQAWRSVISCASNRRGLSR